jgi:phosphatidylethanolamine/phosphatidyl-N-methylethanolamine N-methyltransferase
LSAKHVLVDVTSVRHAYRRWAPIYDFTFGTIANAGRKHVVNIINRRKGRVLEVGVGTGLSLPAYASHLKVTGIDLSPEMLDKARWRVGRERLHNVEGLHEMDAGALAFPDESFDTVVAMYVLTVVPDSDKVMRELERVCAPGGEVILVNHFSQDEGIRGFLERRLAPLAGTIGWRSIFTLDRALVCDDLRLAERKTLWPFGLFTMLRFVKEPASGFVRPPAAEAEAKLPVLIQRPVPIRLRVKWQVARGLVLARRLLDARYWRSLYRRVQSQLAE